MKHYRPGSRFAAMLAACVLLAFLAPAAWAQGTLFVEGDQVGVGIDTPGALLHVQDNEAGFPELFRMENTGSDFAGFRFTTTGGSIDFNKAAGNTFRLNVVDGDTWELQLAPNGNLTIAGSIFTAGSCSSGCDRVFAPGYDLPTIEEHAAAMWSQGHLPVVGVTEEGAPINLTDKTERMLNELEKAHIYIDQLNDDLKRKDTLIEDLEARLVRLEALVEAGN